MSAFQRFLRFLAWAILIVMLVVIAFAAKAGGITVIVNGEKVFYGLYEVVTVIIAGGAPVEGVIVSILKRGHVSVDVPGKGEIPASKHSLRKKKDQPEDGKKKK